MSRFTASFLALALASGCAGARADRRDRDGDGFTADVDCDDEDRRVHPGAQETCDGRDEDCDGQVDEPGGSGEPWWYLDEDGDGWGVHSAQLRSCDPPEGYAAALGDCDDGDASVHPEASETCDGRDEDCDGSVDEGADAEGGPWYLDRDGDGYGDPSLEAAGCLVEGAAYSRRGTDCLDAGPTAGRTYPGAAPADSRTACMQDADGDGWGSTAPLGAAVVPGQDCDDLLAARHPGQSERCNGIDDDCDAQIDEGLLGPWYRDADGDGWGDASTAWSVCPPPAGWVGRVGDCDDSAAHIHPGATELPCDGLDDDCDGVGDGDCDWFDLDSDAIVYTGEYAGNHAGAAVAGAGDVDGDGLDDMLIGAPGYGTTPTAAQAYLVLGSGAPASMDLSSADTTIDGGRVANATGWALAGAGDVDGDGLDDMLIGVPGYDGVGLDSGEACLVLGSPTPADLTITGATACFVGEDRNDHAGQSVAGLGDFNGDGFADMLVGAPTEGSGDPMEGAAYLVLGQASPSDQPLSRADAVWVGAGLWASAGWAVAGPGDVDGDGLDDALIGAPNSGAGRGRVFLVRGNEIPCDRRLMGGPACFLGLDPSDSAGMALAGAGDVDGDGLADILVGAPWHEDSVRGVGAAYLVLGGISSSGHTVASADARFLGSGYQVYAGSAVAGPGDLDGDGFADLLVGIAQDDSPGFTTGAACVVLGGPSLLGVMYATEAQRLQGSGERDMAGTAVAGAGDVDGDGLPDLLVGARNNDRGGEDAGRAYLILGGGLAW